MANNGQKIDELFISLGLDLDQLDLDFVTADKTVQQSISRLNSEKNQVKIKTDIDLANLEGAGSEVDKLKTKEESLNKLLDIQKQKVSILSAVYKDAQQQYGDDNGLTRKAETNYLREEKAAAQLEAELRKLATARTLNAQAAISGAANEEKALSARERVESMNSKMSGAINDVQNIALGGVGGAATSLLPRMGVPGLVAAGIGGTVFGIAEIAKPAMEAGDAIYKLQQTLHTTSGQARQMGLIFKLGGADVSSAIPAFLRLDKQMMQAGVDNTMLGQTLQHFGVDLKDAQGNLLPYTDQLAQLAAGYKKAEAAGQAEEFVTQALGARGAELIPILERYNELIGESSKIVTSGLLNPDDAHKLSEEWHQMDAQAAQLKLAISAALIPAAAEIIPEVESALANMTQLVNENKTEIKDLATLFASMGSIATSSIGGIITALGKMSGVLDKVGLGLHSISNGAKADADSMLKNPTVGWERTALPIGMMVAGGFTANPLLFGGGAAMLTAGTFANLQDKRKSVDSTSTSGMGDFRYADEQSNPSQQTSADALVNPQIIAQNKKLDSQIGDTQYALANPNSPLEIQLHNNIVAINEERDAAVLAGADKAKAFELASLKIQKAEQDYAKAVRESTRQVSDSLFQLTHSDLESAVHMAEEQAQVWREQGINSTLIAQEEEAKKAKIYKDFEENTASKVDAVWKSSLQNRLDDIDREKRAYIQKGIDEVKAAEWAERQKNMTMQQAAQQALKENKQYLDVVKDAMLGPGTYEQRINAAKLNVLQLMREKSGMSNEYMTPDLLKAYSSAMNFANNNLIRGLETDQLAKTADSSKIPIARGTNISYAFNIENVVTPDSEGMRYLVNAVSDNINDTLKPVLGGDDNSY